MEELSCQELVALVTDYLDDALPPTERARFDIHLANCPARETYLGQIRATVALTRASSELETRPEVSRLLDAFRNWKRAGRE